MVKGGFVMDWLLKLLSPGFCFHRVGLLSFILQHQKTHLTRKAFNGRNNCAYNACVQIPFIETLFLNIISALGLLIDAFS